MADLKAFAGTLVKPDRKEVSDWATILKENMVSEPAVQLLLLLVLLLVALLPLQKKKLL